MDCEHSDTDWNLRGRCGGPMAQPVQGHAIQAGPEVWEETEWSVCPLALLGGDGAGGAPRARHPDPWLSDAWNLRAWLEAGRPLDDFCGPLTAGASDALLVLDGEVAARDRMAMEAARSKGGRR